MFLAESVVSLLISLLLNGISVGAMVGGNDAVLGEYTFNVVLRRNEIYYCSGAVISTYHVITAAHCVIRDDDETFQYLPLQVVAKTNNYSNPKTRGTEIEVVKCYVPSKYFFSSKREMIDGDIAVLELAQPLDLSIHNKLLSSLILPTSQIFEGDVATVFGFGWNWVSLDCETCDPRIVGGSLGNLRFAETEILPLSDCEYVSDGKPYGPKHICARMKQRHIVHEGLCNGDSGGPLVYDKRILIGIVRSNNMLCDETYIPSIYTEVAPYTEFILKSLRGSVDDSMYVIYMSNQESNVV